MACWDGKGRKVKHLVGHKTCHPRARKPPTLSFGHMTVGDPGRTLAAAEMKVHLEGRIGERREGHGAPT